MKGSPVRLSALVDATGGGLVPVLLDRDPLVSAVVTTDLLDPSR